MVARMGEIFSNNTINFNNFSRTTFDFLWVTTTCTLLLWFVQFIWGRRRLYYLASKLPGPPSLPFLGSALHFVGNNYEIFYNTSRMFETYPGVFKIWLGPKLLCGIANPKYFELLLTKCLQKDRRNISLDVIMGKGLITAKLSSWKVQRKMIQPTFNQQILDSYVEVFAEQGEALDKIFDKYAGKGEFNISHIMLKCTLDIICETAMGIKSNIQVTDVEFGKWIDRLLEIILQKVIVIWYSNDLIFNLLPIGRECREIKRKLYELTGRVLKEKKKALEERQKNSIDMYTESEPPKRKAFLDYLIEVTDDDHSHFTEKELQDEVILFLIAGTDTSATTLCFALTMLGLYQDLQEKVFDEIIDVLGPDRKPEASDLINLKYLERFIKETLRLFPVTPFIVRAVEEDVDLGECIIPADSSVLFGVLRVHTNEKYWPDPYRFDPDRFLPEEVAKRHPCTYIPFSYGPRNCIGLKYAMMSMKSVMATIVRRYKIFTHYEKVQDIKLKIDAMLKPKDGYKIYIQRRRT